MLPMDMITDPNMTEGCLKVYGYLKYCRWRANRESFSVGQRLLARELHLNSRTIQHAIERLVEAGYVRYAEDPKPCIRSKYKLRD